MRPVLLCLLLALVVATPARGEDRLRGLTGVETTLLAEPGALLAGDVPVYAVPGRLLAWPDSGGRAAVLSRLPDLGPVHPDGVFTEGDLRVWAAQPGRVVVARSGGAPIAPDFDRRRGHQLVVGPPTGPWHDPAGCGEASGGPAALDGDLLAHVAAPAARPACPRGVAAAVTGRSIVVRDLAAGDAVRAVVGVSRARRALTGIKLAWPFLAYGWRGDEELSVGVAVVDLRDGRQLAAAAPAVFRQWTLLPDGGLLVADPPAQLRDDGLCGSRGRVRLLRADAPAAPVGIRPCMFGLFAVREGRLVYGEDGPDGRVQTISLDVASGDRQHLATSSGVPVDVSAGRVVLQDDTCTSGLDLRIAERTSTPVEPAGPRRCPARVGTLRRADGGFALPVRCPRGCRLALRGPARDRFVGRRLSYVRVPPRGRTLRLSGERAGARPSVRVEVLHPVGRPTRLVRRLPRSAPRR